MLIRLNSGVTCRDTDTEIAVNITYFATQDSVSYLSAVIMHDNVIFILISYPF